MNAAAAAGLLSSLSSHQVLVQNLPLRPRHLHKSLKIQQNRHRKKTLIIKTEDLVQSSQIQPQIEVVTKTGERWTDLYAKTQNTSLQTQAWEKESAWRSPIQPASVACGRRSRRRKRGSAGGRTERGGWGAAGEEETREIRARAFQLSRLQSDGEARET